MTLKLVAYDFAAKAILDSMPAFFWKKLNAVLDGERYRAAASRWTCAAAVINARPRIAAALLKLAPQ